MSDEKQFKQIPYGITDYDIFQEEDLYYVDKTRFIRNIEEKGRYLFFIRPRRFGKSLFLSILEDYYDILKQDAFDSLFNGTDIHRNPTKGKNSYLVFKLNFSMIDPEKSGIEAAFLHYVKESAIAFLTRYNQLLDIDPEKVKETIHNLRSASSVMITALNSCTGKKVKLYIIIDEYDNFANTILSDSGEDAYRCIPSLLRSFFKAIKGGTTGSGAPISRLFMTGVSPVSLDDVISGFNIAMDISQDPNVNEMLGFTQTEVETLIDYYRQTGKIMHSTQDLMHIMRLWYNHYRFSKYANGPVYNPSHVLYFLDEYMKQSRIPDELIDYNVRIDYQKFLHFIISDKKRKPRNTENFTKLQQTIGDTVRTRIKQVIPVEEVHDPENFFSLLFYFGLLTIQEMDEVHSAILAIPNESVKRLFYEYIRKIYET
ncbi:MAG: AAA family ATPase [Candidatus Omnitrophota bacterium]